MLLLKLDYLICNNSTAHLSALCFAHTLDAVLIYTMQLLCIYLGLELGQYTRAQYLNNCSRVRELLMQSQKLPINIRHNMFLWTPLPCCSKPSLQQCPCPSACL